MHDIKFAARLSDKQKLRLLAADSNRSLTAFCSELVRNELARYRTYDRIIYPGGGPLIHVKLNDDYYTMLQTLAIQWDLPIRHAVHRLIANYLRDPNPSDAMIISYQDL